MIHPRYLVVFKKERETEEEYWQRFLRTCQTLIEDGYRFIVTEEEENCIRIEFTDADKELDMEVPYMVFQDEIDIIETAREHKVPLIAKWIEDGEEQEVRSFWEEEDGSKTYS